MFHKAVSVSLFCHSRDPLVDARDCERGLVLERLRDQVRVRVGRLAVAARRRTAAILLSYFRHKNSHEIHESFSTTAYRGRGFGRGRLLLRGCCRGCRRRSSGFYGGGLDGGDAARPHVLVIVRRGVQVALRCGVHRVAGCWKREQLHLSMFFSVSNVHGFIAQEQ